MTQLTRKRLIKDRIVDIVDKITGRRIKSVFGKSIQVGIPSDGEFNQSTITINDYTFPVADGENQQAILTDGAGNLYWGSPGVGAQGPPGEQGIQGETGATGATGADGADGTNGTDGEDGSAITIFLEPLSVLLIADSAGNVTDYTPSGATINVYENGTRLQPDTRGTPDPSSYQVTSATGTDITAGSITHGIFQTTISDASSITSDTAHIDHVVSVKNKFGTTTNYTVVQTVAKAIAGTDGADGSDATINLSNVSTATGDTGTSGRSISTSTDSTVNWDPQGYSETDTDGLITPESAAIADHIIKIDKAGIYSLTGSCFKISTSGPADNTYSWNAKLEVIMTKHGQSTVIYRQASSTTFVGNYIPSPAGTTAGFEEFKTVFTANEDSDIVARILTVSYTGVTGQTFDLVSSGSVYGKLEFRRHFPL